MFDNIFNENFSSDYIKIQTIVFNMLHDELKFQPKWDNSDYIWYWVNSLRLGRLQNDAMEDQGLQASTYTN